MTHANTNRRDSNEKDIIAYWRQMGCLWISWLPGQGADGLLIDRSGLFVVEIKHPSGWQHLTQCERNLRDAVEGLGGAYNVVTSIQDAAKLIGLEVENDTR
jgi:hypothetical protein